MRNLCYMVSKREKMKKQYYKSRVEVFQGLNNALVDKRLSDREAQKISELYPEDCIYYNFDATMYESVEEPKQEIHDDMLLTESKEERFVDILQDDDTQDYIPELSSLSPRKDQEIVHVEEGFTGKFGLENVVKELKLNFQDNKLAETKKARYKRKKELKERNFCDVFMNPDEIDMSETDYRLRSTTLSGSTSKLKVLRNGKTRRKTIDCLTSKTQDIASDCDPPASPVKRELRTRRQTGDSEICVNENSISPRELRCSSINVKEGPKEIGVVRNLSKTAKAGSITERVKAEINSYILTSKLVVADYIKETVQKGLLENKRNLRNNFLNGMIDRSKKKENHVTVNGKTNTLGCLSPVNGRRSISRVLNEISPSRASTPSENSWYKNLRGSPTLLTNGENIHDPDFSDQNSPGPTTRSVRRKIDNGYDSDSREAFSARSSRENSPASIRGFRRGIKIGSDSPSSRKSYTDSNHGYIDVENICNDSENTQKRVTRSQVMSDNENSRDSLDFKETFTNIIS